MEIHLVVATNERQSRFWAVAAPPNEAIELVGQLAAPGSAITPTDRTLTLEMLAALKLKPGHARELPFGPRMGSWSGAANAA